MNNTFGNRQLIKIDLEYALHGPGGWRTPDTHSKIWFFEIPSARSSDDRWNELLHRIFYDSNVRLRRNEPGDEKWLGLESFRASPVDTDAVLATDWKSWAAFPWLQSEKNMVWETSASYFVDDAGHYDVMTGGDYTELVMLRLVAVGAADEKGFVEFFDHFYQSKSAPSAGRTMYDDRVARLNNLVVVRPSSNYQKPPDAKPWASGPVDPAVV